MAGKARFKPNLAAVVETVFLIVGLGNPGGDYAQTRHNAGFLLLDALATRWKANWSHERKFESALARAEAGIGADGTRRRLILCKPQTFMNASGEAVGLVATFYKVPAARVLVAVDDADLSLGEIRMRPSGSSGGHHGLESIEQHLGTREYPRLRIGIGRDRPAGRQIAGYVLAPFQPSERPVLEKVLFRACEQAECWFESGVVMAMNKFNGAAKE